MTFSKCSCHVTPLYKNLHVLTPNDVYRIELAKFMHILHHGALHKIYDNIIQNISNFHSFNTRFADNQNYFIQRVYTNYVKKYFLQRGCLQRGSGKKSNRV